jgi:AMP phosphorylase
MTALIVALEIRGANDEEVVDFTNAMANSGEVLKFEETVYDKHSTGGVPGNKVTLIIVPIVAAAGLFIPKTSTRAITSPSGTADSFEALAPVTFSREKMLEIFKTERAGILWGGAIDSAPADNALINVEKPLNMDPFPLMICNLLFVKKKQWVFQNSFGYSMWKRNQIPNYRRWKEFALRFKEIAKRVGIDRNLYVNICRTANWTCCWTSSRSQESPCIIV